MNRNEPLSTVATLRDKSYFLRVAEELTQPECTEADRIEARHQLLILGDLAYKQRDEIERLREQLRIADNLYYHARLRHGAGASNCSECGEIQSGTEILR